MSGTVVELGAKATKKGLKPGDKVTGNFIRFCGACYYCRKGMFEGEYVKYYSSGKVKEKVQFLHDQRHGNRYLYDTEGNPMPGEKYWNGNFTGFIL